ncbi:MAG: DMT family transporter [Clostridia bacterium]|nr:DMT family transporter [Clostridia bacterium]
MKNFISPIILLLAAIIWGAAFVAQKAAAALAPLTLIAVRSIFAVIFLIPAVAVYDRLTHSGRSLLRLRGGLRLDLSRRELIGGAVCGTFLFIASTLQQAGIAETDAGKASFITALYVVIVPLLSLALGKRSGLNVWCAATLAVVGFYLLCITDSFSLAPSDLIILLCAVVFAFQIISIDKSLARGTCPIRLSLVQFFTCAVLSSVSAPIFEGPIDFSLIGGYLPELLFLGIGSSGIAYTCQIIGQRGTPAPVATVILSLESVFGALSAALLLGERMSAREYIGCAVVFAAVLIAELGPASFRKSDGAPQSDGQSAKCDGKS